MSASHMCQSGIIGAEIPVRKARPIARLALRPAAAVLVLAVVFPVAAAAVTLRLQYAGTPPPAAVTRGRDALGLGPPGVDGRKTPADANRLAATLRDTGVR